MIDLLVYCFVAVSFISYSISLFDGYIYFVLIWISSIFISTANSTALNSDFVRLIWILFASGLLLSRLTVSRHHFAFARRLIVSGENARKAPISINSRTIKYIFIFIFLVFLLKTFGYSGSNDFSNSIHSQSKSPIVYTVEGIISSLSQYWILSLAVISNSLSFSQFKIFANRIIPFRLFLELISSFKYASFLSVYGTKFILPFYSAIETRFLAGFYWHDLLPKFFKLRIKRHLLNLLALSFILFASSLMVFQNIGISFFDLLNLKVLGRADAYFMLDNATLSELVSVYGGNIFYFFHPFLKILGLKAYDMPMGTYLISRGSDFTAIGGPNIHLPVALFCIFYGNLVAKMTIVFTAFASGYLLSLSRLNIISSLYRVKNFIPYWSVFFYFNFVLLVTEPSAFGHRLFFATIGYFIIKLFSNFLVRLY